MHEIPEDSWAEAESAEVAANASKPNAHQRPYRTVRLPPPGSSPELIQPNCATMRCSHRIGLVTRYSLNQSLVTSYGTATFRALTISNNSHS